MFSSRAGCVTQHAQRLHYLPAELNTLFRCVCSHGWRFCDRITTSWYAHLRWSILRWFSYIKKNVSQGLTNITHSLGTRNEFRNCLLMQWSRAVAYRVMAKMPVYISGRQPDKGTCATENISFPEIRQYISLRPFWYRTQVYVSVKKERTKLSTSEMVYFSNNLHFLEEILWIQ